MQPTRPRRLWSDNLGHLELSFRIRRADDGLELSPFGGRPLIVPDDPGVGRHGLFDLALVPCPACVETQFNFADAVWPAEGDSPEFLLDSAKRLIMSWGIDT